MTDELFAGRYRRLGSLGRGAMGEVWLAEDTLLGRRVAIKQLLPVDVADEDDQAIDRMMREARTAAQLHHRFIVTVFDLVVVGGRPHVVMEYVEGESLAERVRRDGPLPVPDVAAIGSAIATALELAHRRGIVHRDVKPANIMLDESGEAKLADFGIARQRDDASLTRSGHLIGTIAYMAPEVARTGVASPASDVWSLGATLFAALEGHPPFDDGSVVSTTQMLLRLVTEVPPRARRAGDLADLLARMMDPSADARPDSGAVSTALVDAQAAASSTAGVAHAGDSAPQSVPEPTVTVRRSPAVQPVAPEPDHTVLRESGQQSESAPVRPTWIPPTVAPRAGRSRAPVAVASGVVLLLVVAGIVWALTSGSSGNPSATRGPHDTGVAAGAPLANGSLSPSSPRSVPVSTPLPQPTSVPTAVPNVPSLRAQVATTRCAADTEGSVSASGTVDNGTEHVERLTITIFFTTDPGGTVISYGSTTVRVPGRGSAAWSVSGVRYTDPFLCVLRGVG